MYARFLSQLQILWEFGKARQGNASILGKVGDFAMALGITQDRQDFYPLGGRLGGYTVD